MALPVGLCVAGTTARAQGGFECPPAPPPVLSMAYDSRYEDEDASRSEIDRESNAEVNATQKPLDDFIRDLNELANAAHPENAPQQAIADCVVAQVATWARAGALRDLQTDTVRMTFGSRLAGVALALRQVRGKGGTTSDWQDVRDWLDSLARAQLTYWEEDAPDGASQGNLRAWAALGIAATADILQDPVMRGWAAWSAHYVTCTANPDGSLPREMARGRLALHYQMHAVAPLVVTARLLSERGFDLRASCDGALDRAVAFTLADIEGGEKTRAITGEVQSYFDGTREITGYHVAWLEAWLSLAPGMPDAAAAAERFRPLSSSKLGGDQGALWH